MFRDINVISNICFNTVVLIVSPGVKHLNTFQLQRELEDNADLLRVY